METAVKYIEVVRWFVLQHLRTSIVLALIAFVLVALWCLAEREYRQTVTRFPEDKHNGR